MTAADAGSRFPVRAWFNLARAGNFPSVASNVLAALVLSSRGPGWPAGPTLAVALAAGCLAYAGGATLNDVFDARFDEQHRPERAIPRGLVSRTAAGIVGGLELMLGLSLLVWAGASVHWAAGLGTVIVAYDWSHKRWGGSVVLMAGCRALLAVTIASLPGQSFAPVFLGWVAVLFIYIVALSVIARWEYRPGAPAEKLGRMVGGLLAFIPLVDAGALLLAGAWLPAVACAAAIPLGRLAQRLAAST